MEGFTLALALVDAIPVVLYSISMILIAVLFRSPLFILGAVISALAGCMKVSWKLVLGISGKNLSWLNKPFLPIQITGFLMMLVSFLLNMEKIDLPGVLAAMSALPAVIFFSLWLILMGSMSWFRRTKFDRNNAKHNWIAQIINCCAQASLLCGILLSQ